MKWRTVFIGDTLTFKEGFTAWKVPGRYETLCGEPLPDEAPQEAKNKGVYARVIKRLNVEEENKKLFVLNLFGKHVQQTVFAC